MSRSFRLLPVLSLLLIGALHLRAQTPATPANAEGEIRQAIRQYDEALRKGDAATTKKFWADEYTFVNPQGERVSRADRIKNLKTGQTALSSVVHDPKKDQIRIYGDVAVYTALLTVAGQYSGQAAKGQDRVLVVWIRRDGRWQQLATQMTTVAGR
jgi:ketosteroid isomerase-like protein